MDTTISLAANYCKDFSTFQAIYQDVAIASARVQQKYQGWFLHSDIITGRLIFEDMSAARWDGVLWVEEDHEQMRNQDGW